MTDFSCSPVSETDESAFAVLREVEIPWLSNELSRAIAGLGYPVGMGIPPHPEQIERAAAALFERYAKMIEMARTARLAQTPMGREQIAKIFAVIWHGDIGEWQGFLSKADAFLAYPRADTSTVCQCKPLTRYADAPHDEGCPLAVSISSPIGKSQP